MTSRGYTVGDASNPAECVHLYTRGQNQTCKLMVVEYTGPETLEMIDVAIERARILPQNIAVLPGTGAIGARETQDTGCFVLPQPFSMEKFVGWVVASEDRCGQRQKARRRT